jgi:hypothetical protein
LCCAVFDAALVHTQCMGGNVPSHSNGHGGRQM